ncbi:integrase-like protein [Azospirillum brasilense]|uniref:Integrase-like protein n=1 Tax=Azospirillum brasilense TaxID=192 RepID=A0A560BBQ5_AZOBR|nr:integrase-like protein [Azospirillum brasilense]
MTKPASRKYAPEVRERAVRVSRTAHAGFALDALEQALHDRRPAKGSGLIHHSDRGSQYVAIRYTERLTEAGVEPSVGSVGDSYDSALAETINGLYKTEVIRRRGPPGAGGPEVRSGLRRSSPRGHRRH